MMIPANLFAAAFIFLTIYAVVSDVSRLVIPNWLPAALIVLFFLFVLFCGTTIPIGYHVFVAAAVFAGGFGMFVMNWMAGGDVKLLAAVALWAGPAHILRLLLITSIAGAALALLIMAGSFYVRCDGSGGAPTTLSRLFPRWIRQGLTPYGFAIGVGALATIPTAFF